MNVMKFAMALATAAVILTGCGSSDDGGNGDRLPDHPPTLADPTDHATITNLTFLTANGNPNLLLRSEPQFSIQSTVNWKSGFYTYTNAYHIVDKALYDANSYSALDSHVTELTSFSCGENSILYSCNQNIDFTCTLTDYSIGGIHIDCPPSYNDTHGSLVLLSSGEKYLVHQACVFNALGALTCNYEAQLFTLQ